MKNFIEQIIKTLVAYVRVSTDRQDKEGFSIEGQIEAITKWAEANDVRIVKWYNDAGVSGTRSKRPQYDLMEKELCNGLVDADGLIVFSTSRMGRNLAVTSATKNKLMSSGKVIISALENLVIKDASSNLVFNILGAVNENQSQANGEHVKKQLGLTASQGAWTGGIVPYGYISTEVDINGKTRHKLAINPEESVVIEMIFKLSLEGLNGKPMGVVSIAAHLNKNGLTNRGKSWDKNKIDKILNNTLYKGVRKYRKGRPDEILIKEPKIINEFTFDQVIKGLESRQLKNTEYKGVRSKSFLTGIMKCSQCGKNYMITTGKSGTHKYYSCMSKKNRGANFCSMPNIPMKKAENAIKEALLKTIYTPERILKSYKEIQSLASSVNKTELSIFKKVEKNYNKNKERLHTLLDKLCSQEIELDCNVREYKDQLSNKLNFFKSEYERLNYRRNLRIFKFGKRSAEYFHSQISSAFNGGNDELAKTLLLATVSEIRVRKSELIIKGSKHQLVNLVSHTKKGTPLRVPSIVSIWR